MLVSYSNELQIMRTEPFRMILNKMLVRTSRDGPGDLPEDGWYHLTIESPGVSGPESPDVLNRYYKSFFSFCYFNA